MKATLLATLLVAGSLGLSRPVIADGVVGLQGAEIIHDSTRSLTPAEVAWSAGPAAAREHRRWKQLGPGVDWERYLVPEAAVHFIRARGMYAGGG